MTPKLYDPFTRRERLNKTSERNMNKMFLGFLILVCSIGIISVLKGLLCKSC